MVRINVKQSKLIKVRKHIKTDNHLKVVDLSLENSGHHRIIIIVFCGGAVISNKPPRIIVYIIKIRTNIFVCKLE